VGKAVKPGGHLIVGTFGPEGPTKCSGLDVARYDALFHVLNGSATEIRSLALPGHTFKVVALDGNAVPTPSEVPVLWLGTAERISAIVEMKHPGV
jgi:FtsP/CotA-like multicopper oxidase with cupredoxin domain